jgi:dihydroneopterin aldolase
VSNDVVELRGLRAVGTHGVLAEEQSRAQPFMVDIDVGADLSGAGQSDNLNDTLDYGALVESAVRVVMGEHHALLERVAQRIADEVLSDPRAEWVTVRVVKLRPQVAADLATAAVRITRTR